MLWNFSPLPEQSNMRWLDQFPVLAIRTAAELTAEPGVQMSYSYGQTVAVPLPRSMPGAVAAFRPPSAKADQPLLTDARQGFVTIAAGELGPYDVRFTDAGRRVERGFSVNAEAAESDLRPMDPVALAAMFPPGLLVTSDVSEVAQRRAIVRQKLDLSPPLLVALLVLVTAESFFANRFYRRAAMPAPT